MDELNKHQISEVIGCKESEVEAILLTRFGEQNIQYLAQLAKITQLSLKANRLIISQCRQVCSYKWFHTDSCRGYSA